jgi:hydroxysqualene synthase
MTTHPSGWRSGKSHRDENFPVASRLIHPRHREIILAFYDFVRTADDIADHATLKESEKLDLLSRLEAGLLGAGEDIPEAVTLRNLLQGRDLPPIHAQHLLEAFRLDVTKRRYRDWDDLMHYCSYSAMPVGRFVLDVHREDRSTWPASDALCAALQVINHLQDCGADYRNLDRVYVPLDALAAAGASVEELGAAAASPALRKCLRELAAKTKGLLAQAAALSPSVNDLRLALEISVIETLAKRLVEILAIRDPLGEKVHFGAFGFATIGAMGVASGAFRRIRRVWTLTGRPHSA